MSYNQAIKNSLPAFAAARLMPTIGASAVFLLMAHKSPENLAVFAYVLAAASVVSAFFSLILATVGNRAASLTLYPAAQRNLFTGGFTLAVLLAALTTLVCLAAMYLAAKLGSIEQVHRNTFWTHAFIYVASAPLLVINTFLQLFLEATGKASSCSNAKIRITILCGGTLALLSTTVSSNEFQYYATSYFFTTELLILLCLTRLSKEQNYCSLKCAKKYSSYFARTGVPIAAGLSGQKLYFYLLTERLARIDTHLIAELSIFMTAIGILSIPSLALSQIHSLQVSQCIDRSGKYFRTGLVWMISIMTLSSIILYLFGGRIFSVFGRSATDYSSAFYFTTVIFLASSSLLAFTLAHLRARNETLTPQLLTNAMMLGILIPIIYKFQPEKDASIEFFLILQSAAALISFLLLCLRVLVVHRRDQAREDLSKAVQSDAASHKV